MVRPKFIAKIPLIAILYISLFLQTITAMAYTQLPEPLLNLQKIVRGTSVNSWHQSLTSFSQFARKPGQERWQLQTLKLSDTQKETIHKDLTELGFINAITPSCKKYKAAVITGGAVPRMILRIEYLTSLWQQGIRFEKVVLIAGQRPLEDYDNISKAITSLQSQNKIAPLRLTPENTPCHEAEAQRLLYTLFKKPPDMEKLPVAAEDKPRRWDTTGQKWIRPGTGDTFNQLIEKNKDDDNFLIVTSQPYVFYMDAVYKNQLVSLSNPPFIDVVGAEAPSSTRTVEYLNAVYEWLKAITPLVEPMP